MRTLSHVTSKAVVEPFHRLYYDSGAFTWSDTRWLGTPVQKCPLDLWIYQEIVEELRPAVIVECGTAFGGSGHFLATLCDLVGHGEVVSIDIEEYENRPMHDRLTYVQGSSVASGVISEVERRIDGREPVMVLLDSDHSKAHVLEELRAYGPMVTRGSYLIVEDTNVNGHPVASRFGPGPTEAVAEFLGEGSDFFVDRTREKFFLTFNPGGYLRKRERPPAR